MKTKNRKSRKNRKNRNPLARFSTDKLLAEVRRRSRKIICVKVWQRADIEDWLNENRDYWDPRGEDEESGENFRKIVNAAMRNRKDCGLGNCTDGDYECLEYFIQEQIRRLNLKTLSDYGWNAQEDSSEE